MNEEQKIIKKEIAIIGGGITGLAAAHRLVELCPGNAPDLVLLEKKYQAGGVISSSTYLDAFFENGPDSFIVQKPWALDLCRRLGLEEHILPTNEKARATFIAFGDKLHMLPEGFVMLAPTRFLPFLTSPLFSLPGKLRMALDLFLPRGKNARKESLAEFVRRRLGREALERVAQPMVGGIYTCCPEKLSLAETMPRFIELEEKYGSLIYGLWKESGRAARGARYSMFVTLDEGLELLVKRLCRLLPEGSLCLGLSVNKVHACPEGFRLYAESTTGERQIIEAKKVIVCTQAHQAAGILETLDDELSKHLQKVPYASSSVLNMFYKDNKIPKLPEGFGFVVPEIEQANILACTISGTKYAGRNPSGMTALRVFLGGAMREEIFSAPDDKLIALARQDLQRYLQIEAAPESVFITRHPLSMPQYHLGHGELIGKIETLQNKHKGLALAGNYFRGVGIPDCIHAGEQAAEKILNVVKTCQTTSK